MKKIVLITALLLAAFFQLKAIPAYRGVIPYTQPDGSVIRIRMHGDEFFHWTTDESGRLVEQGDDGFYHPVSASLLRARRAAGALRRAAVNAERRNVAKRGIAIGQKHFLVILVEFSDVHFKSSTANQDFAQLLNQPGYSLNGATGSARDFYFDNSCGKFEPIFDVYGPVTLTNKQSYYGGNTSSAQGSDRQPYLAVKEGCEALASQIDFSKYDNDGDGDVDLVFMYYAGKGEADGGGTNCIWPHQWELSSAEINVQLGGKKIDRYACSNEIVNYGSLSGKMCGIGTACHEFGHAMGLPDFYDTDYEDNGEAGGLYDYSTMCGGGYNNEGRTPPYLNIEERIMLGWLEEDTALEEISSSGQYNLAPVENNKAMKAACDTEGEYFIFETRGAQGWDAPLPGGLLIYHVDKSAKKVSILLPTGREISVTANDLWANWGQYNAINENGSHPCFYLIPSGNLTSLYMDPYTTGMNDIIFPGRAKVTSYQPIDWEGEETAASISGISYASHSVSFNASVLNTRGIVGFVTNTSGAPLQGVTIHVEPVQETTTHGIRAIKPRSFNAPYIVQTNADGRFEVDLQECTAEQVEVSAYLDGYVTSSQTVTLKPRGNSISFVLLKEGESLPSDLYKYNPNTQLTSLGAGFDVMASVRFTQEELAAYTGNLIQSISFYPNCTSATIYVIIDFGSTRRLTYKVPNPQFGDMMTVSLESLNQHIPESGDVYFGYGIAGADNDYPLVCTASSTFNESYYDNLNLNSSSWSKLQTSSSAFYDIVLSVTVKDEGQDDPGTQDPPQETDKIADMGFSYISVPEDLQLTEGSILPLKLVPGKGYTPMHITWFLDGKIYTGDSITLTKGEHTLRALVVYEDNTEETIEVELEVQ